MISFAKKEKIQATLIQLEKEKFPCSAEAGDAARHHPARHRERKPEAGGQRLVPSQSSRLGSSTLSPVLTRARAAHKPAQRRLPGQRLRG